MFHVVFKNDSKYVPVNNATPNIFSQPGFGAFVVTSTTASVQKMVKKLKIFEALAKIRSHGRDNVDSLRMHFFSRNNNFKNRHCISELLLL